MRSVGGQVGADSNAITSTIDTKYYLEIPINPDSKLLPGNDDLNLLNEALEILSGWAFNMKPTKKEVDHEVNVRCSHVTSPDLTSCPDLT